MNTNESTTPTTARRPKQYGFQPSPYVDKKPVTMRLSKEARDLLDAEARSENTSVTELVEQIVRQRTLRFPDGEKLSAVDFPVDKDETRRNQESAHAEIARLIAERDALEAKWKAATDSLEVYSNDARSALARAEAAEAEAARLQVLLENIPRAASANRDVPKPTFQAIKKYWTDKEQGKWELDSYRGKPFNQMIVDTIYEHWILNQDF